ncbi:MULTISPECIES: helix-turn-helix transcriptional regulator [Nocardioides]|nr:MULTISPECIES: helix-turn-helix domain-containing protein [Nocardioides]
METVKETLTVGGHRTLAAQESERIPEDAGADPDERRLTERGRFVLTPATMNIAQAAAYIGIAKSTLYTWRTRRPGFGPRAVKAGGALRYRRSDLDAWIEAHAETLDLQAETDIDDDGRRSGGDQQARSRTLGSMSRRSRPRHP